MAIYSDSISSNRPRGSNYAFYVSRGAAYQDKDRLEKVAGRVGGVLGTLGAGAGYAAGIIELALHKRAAQHVSADLSTWASPAAQAYDTCLNGTTINDDYDFFSDEFSAVDSACNLLSKLANPACNWDSVWFLTERVTADCLTVVESKLQSIAEHDKRDDALNWLCLLIALPVVMGAGWYVGKWVGRVAVKPWYGLGCQRGVVAGQV